jgi:GNAT superfamily N-acetyltransferase
MMTIRPATLHDTDQICGLLGELGGYDHAGEFLPGRLDPIINHPDHYLLVCEIGGELAGFSSLHIIPELGLPFDTAILRYLVVRDLGRGQGVGRMLEQRCCEIARQRSCGRIQLHCGEQRGRAHGFYRGLGYEESPKWFTKGLG